MAAQLVIAFLTIALVGTIHFLGLRSISRGLIASETSSYVSFLTILMAGTIGQCIAALIFAFSFEISLGLGLGGFDTNNALPFSEIFAFSLVNLTTLGLGDLVPNGGLKLLAGMEAMTGFLLISSRQAMFSK